MIEEVINANNKQCKKLEKMVPKAINQLDSFDIDLEKEYENAEVYRIKRLREIQQEIKEANIIRDEKKLKALAYQRIKIVPDAIEHLPESEQYWGDINNNNGKLTQIGNKFYNKNNQLITDKKMVYKGVFYVKHEQDEIGGIQVIAWDTVMEQFCGMNAETFDQLDTFDKVKLLDEITEKKYEIWIQMKINKYKNKSTLKFVMEHFKEASDESTYDFIEAIDNDSESEDNDLLSDESEEEFEYEEDFVCSCGENNNCTCN